MIFRSSATRCTIILTYPTRRISRTKRKVRVGKQRTINPHLPDVFCVIFAENLQIRKKAPCTMTPGASGKALHRRECRKSDHVKKFQNKKYQSNDNQNMNPIACFRESAKDPASESAKQPKNKYDDDDRPHGKSPLPYIVYCPYRIYLFYFIVNILILYLFNIFVESLD